MPTVGLHYHLVLYCLDDELIWGKVLDIDSDLVLVPLPLPFTTSKLIEVVSRATFSKCRSLLSSYQQISECGLSM